MRPTVLRFHIREKKILCSYPVPEFQVLQNLKIGKSTMKIESKWTDLLFDELYFHKRDQHSKPIRKTVEQPALALHFVESFDIWKFHSVYVFDVVIEVCILPRHDSHQCNGVKCAQPKEQFPWSRYFQCKFSLFDLVMHLDPTVHL